MVVRFLVEAVDQMFILIFLVVRISSEEVKDVAEFGDSNSLTGRNVIANGSSLGTEYANPVTQGIISSLGR